MSPQAAAPDATALADVLRDCAERLAVRRLDGVDLAEAHRLARQLRDRLDGPERDRWYDAERPDPGSSPESRSAYLSASPVRGAHNPTAPPLVLEPAAREDGRPGLTGEVVMGRRYEGPPHGVHGGYVAALFDEVLGAAQGLVDMTGVTAVLRVRYRRITPIGTPLRLSGWVHEQRGRRMIARATCEADGQLTADAEGIFIRVDFERVRRDESPDAADAP